MKNNMCACCGLEEVEPFDICDTCGWQSDSLQNSNHNLTGGANEMSLNEYKKIYQQESLNVYAQ